MNPEFRLVMLKLELEDTLDGTQKEELLKEINILEELIEKDKEELKSQEDEMIIRVPKKKIIVIKEILEDHSDLMLEELEDPEDNTIYYDYDKVCYYCNRVLGTKRTELINREQEIQVKNFCNILCRNNYIYDKKRKEGV
jgi:hypothetical protein